jgi:hypothetical protein
MNERETLTDAVKHEDRRVQLEAIRDYIAHQLEGNLCNTCLNSRLRTGDQASLILRLQNVLDEIEAIPDSEEVNRLDKLRLIHGGEPQRVPQGDPTQQRASGTRRPKGGGIA